MCTVTDVFRQCCEAADVTFKPMNVPHQKLSDAAYQDRGTKGICMALTLLWLSRYFKDLMLDDRFEGRSFGRLVSSVEDDKGLQMVLRQIQQYETSRGMLWGKGSAILSDESQSSGARLSAWGDIEGGLGFKSLFIEGMTALGVRPTHLRVHHCAEGGDHFCCQDDKPSYNHMVRFLTLYEGASLIKFQTHWVGAVCDLNRPKFKFLDVNAGQAITHDQRRFQVFLREFMNSRIVKTYQKSAPVFAVQAY